MGTTPMGMQQPANRVPTIPTKKPLTLSSLGAGNVGFGGAKSVSLSAPKTTPAAPTPAPASTTVKETAPETTAPKKSTPVATPTPTEGNTPVEETISLDTPEEVEETSTTSVSFGSCFYV